MIYCEFVGLILSKVAVKFCGIEESSIVFDGDALHLVRNRIVVADSVGNIK